MQAWDKFLRQQEAELGAETIKKWLRPLQIVRFDACNLYLKATDSFQVLWFEEHMRKKVHGFLFNNNNKRIRVHIATDEEGFTKTVKPPVNSENKVSSTPSPAKFSITFDAIDPNCTFEYYLSSQRDPLPGKVLFQATGYDENLKRVTPLNPEVVTFNPIYLCGPSGTGKTHLLMASAKAFREQGYSVIYVRAETFTEHVVAAIRGGEMRAFRQAYRNADILIIDDVHILSRKWATQEELFHTFNTLHLSGKQIILSANCSPRELPYMEPRLMSRFEWGIVLPIASLQKDELRNILLIKGKALNFLLNTKVVEFLLETFPSNSKALTRAFEALILRAHLNKNSKITPSQLTVPYVKLQLEDLIKVEEKTALTPDRIIQEVTAFFGVRPEDILGKAQTRDCALPRHMAMHFCRIQLKIPFMKIADIFSKNHSTVMSSVKLVQKGLDENNPEIVTPYHHILRKLKS